VGCDGEDGGPGLYPAKGIVEDVDVPGAQVLIDHEDIQGLMPAMTMNFAVPDAALLDRLAAGQVIEFGLRFTGRSYEVESFTVVGEAPFEAGWRRLGDALVRSRPAPAFSLIDQAGRPVTLDSFADKILVVDFIYTECPGPCPIQTANQVALQRRIPEALRSSVHFLSFSLDPEVDRPEVLVEYAMARGADLDTWSFLTGERAAVAKVVLGWGIGSMRQEDGTIDHTLITFLVKDGRVLERYTMAQAKEDTLLRDLEALAAGTGFGTGTVTAPELTNAEAVESGA
jgi:protein SCO1/2